MNFFCRRLTKRQLFLWVIPKRNHTFQDDDLSNNYKLKMNPSVSENGKEQSLPFGSFNGFTCRSFRFLLRLIENAL